MPNSSKIKLSLIPAKEAKMKEKITGFFCFVTTMKEKIDFIFNCQCYNSSIPALKKKKKKEKK